VESVESDSSSPNSSTTPTPWSNTMVTLMGSRSTLCCMRSSSGTSRRRGSFITTKPSISTPSENSWLMNLTQTLSREPSTFSNQDSSIQTISGPSSTPSSADSTPHHTNSSWTATLSLELTPTPKPNGHDSRSSDVFHPTRDAFVLSPSISIFVNEPFPFVHFQVPFSIPLCIDFPNHSSPPFVRVRTDPTFDRHFIIRISIRKLARRSTFTLDKTFPPHPFYVFSIRISPCNITNHPLHDNAGTRDVPNTSHNPCQPPTPSSSPRQHLPSLPSQAQTLSPPPPTPSQPHRLR